MKVIKSGTATALFCTASLASAFQPLSHNVLIPLQHRVPQQHKLSKVILFQAPEGGAASTAATTIAPRKRRSGESGTALSSSNTEESVSELVTSRSSGSSTSATTSVNGDSNAAGAYVKDAQQRVILTDSDTESEEYKKGFATIAFITLLNASLSPVWHVIFEGANTPPPLFLNALVSITALIGLLGGAQFLESKVEKAAAAASETKWSQQSFRGGMELGLWKGLGTTCHIFGMSLTTANHGAFLLQMTTLIVPVMQGLRGAEDIPRQVQLAIALALAGIVAFTQDPNGVAAASQLSADSIQTGDLLVLAAAFFYSLYDIQTFYWGKKIPRTELVTIKIGFQAVLSILLCVGMAQQESRDYVSTMFANLIANGVPGGDIASSSSAPNGLLLLLPTVLWSGLIVNALATFLQVGGMQSVGPTRAQTIFASQPLWASLMNFAFLGEIMGAQGFVGGGAFLGALFLAATSKNNPPPPASLEGEEEERTTSDNTVAAMEAAASSSVKTE